MIFCHYRNTSSFSSDHTLMSSGGSYGHDEWHTDLLGCCSEPLLCKFFLLAVIILFDQQCNLLITVIFSPFQISCLLFFYQEKTAILNLRE